jgi:hypothetical protein
MLARMDLFLNFFRSINFGCVTYRELNFSTYYHIFVNDFVVSEVKAPYF